MKPNRSPFGIERRLTPELFDHYIAKARTERARAIAAFGAELARRLRAAVAQIAHPGRSRAAARNRAE